MTRARFEALLDDLQARLEQEEEREATSGPTAVGDILRWVLTGKSDPKIALVG